MGFWGEIPKYTFVDDFHIFTCAIQLNFKMATSVFSIPNLDTLNYLVILTF